MIICDARHLKDGIKDTVFENASCFFEHSTQHRTEKLTARRFHIESHEEESPYFNASSSERVSIFFGQKRQFFNLYLTPEMEHSNRLVQFLFVEELPNTSPPRSVNMDATCS